MRMEVFWMEITLEQVERLREKANVSYSQAKAALEHTGGDLLEAIIYLERQGQTTPPQNEGVYATQTQANSREVLDQALTASQAQDTRTFLEKLVDLLRDLLHRGLINSLTVSREGDTLVAIPLVITLALLLIAPWVTVPLLIVGLVIGCQYSFTGADVEKEPVIKAMDTFNGAVARVRQQVIDALLHYGEQHKKGPKKER